MAPKGKLKPSLRTLKSHRATSEEMSVVERTFLDAHPIVTAVLGIALIEHELDELIRGRLSDPNDAAWDRLTDISGPLSTIKAKIELGAVFRFYNEAARKNLIIATHIRNAFAHTHHLIDFQDEAVAEELGKIVLSPKARGNWAKMLRWAKTNRTKDGRQAYVNLCLSLAIVLLRKQIKIQDSRKHYQTRRYNRAMARLAAINPAAGWLTAPPVGFAPQFGLGALGQSLGYQTAYPNFLALYTATALPDLAKLAAPDTKDNEKK